MVFVIHWHESAMDLHVVPCLFIVKKDLSKWSLSILPVQILSLFNCTFALLLILFTILKFASVTESLVSSLEELMHKVISECWYSGLINPEMQQYVIVQGEYFWSQGGSLTFKMYVTSTYMSLSMCPWTVARQALLATEFSRQDSCSGLPFPSPGDLWDPKIEPGSLRCIAGRFFTIWANREGPLMCQTF